MIYRNGDHILFLGTKKGMDSLNIEFLLKIEIEQKTITFAG